VFDGHGNIGPTLWWDGEVVGSWAVAPNGEVRTVVLADRGADATAAVRDAAALLQQRLGGAVVTPAFRTPLERSLVKVDRPCAHKTRRRRALPRSDGAVPGEEQAGGSVVR
jgi:hypothetical protein